MATGVLPQIDRFKRQIREFFCKNSSDWRPVRVARNKNIYVLGQSDVTVYFLHMGQVKLMLTSPDAKECLFAVRTAGDLIGELCLAGQTARFETAVAMEDCFLKQMPAHTFLSRLRSASLLEGLVQYLAGRLAEQQEVIASLAMLNSERRLAHALIQISEVLGHPDGSALRLAQRISQEELAGMVGTTRTRTGMFLKKFRELGLIELTPERCLVVDRKGLKSYLDNYAAEDETVCPYRKVEPESAGGEIIAKCLLNTETEPVEPAITQDFANP